MNKRFEKFQFNVENLENLKILLISKLKNNSLIQKIKSNSYKEKIKKIFKARFLKKNLGLPSSDAQNYQEVRYKPIPKWTKSLQWTIVGFISLGFLYSLIARIDEVVIAQVFIDNPDSKSCQHAQ